MAGNPNSWWSSTNGSNLHPHQESHQLPSSSTSSFLSSPLYLYGPSSVSSLSSTSMADHQSNQDFPRSWSQLLLGSSGLPNDQERYGTSELCRYNNRVENWEENVINNQSSSMIQMIDEKQEVDQNHNFFGHASNDEYHNQVSRNSWAHHQLNLVSSPTSCVTSLSSNLLNFSSNKQEGRRERSDNSTEGNNTTGGLSKKARVQHSSTQPALKVRKEKLGDRITALHQLVSPFGKTDTASVLSEAIGYIRFLIAQIEGLSSPYLGNVSKSMGHQHSVQDRNCLYPMEAGQESTHPRDLKSKGLCLVPVSCTQHVGNDNNNGADYFTPALGGGF